MVEEKDSVAWDRAHFVVISMTRRTVAVAGADAES